MEEHMNINLSIRVIAIATTLAISACTTVVEKREPVTTSTTVTEKTSSHYPLNDSTTTQTTRTQTR